MRRKLLIAVVLASLSLVARAMPPSPPEPPLFTAIAKGDLKSVKKLLKDGEAPDVRDPTGRTGLVRAAAEKQDALVQYFIGRSADLDARDLYGNTALHYTALTGSDAATKSLLKAGASPRVWNRRCESPLDVASAFGYSPLFKTLVGKAKALPLPSDGTEEECALNPTKAKAPSYAAAFQTFFARQLSIEAEGDYVYATGALARLQKDPRAVVQAEMLVPALAGLVAHRSPETAVQAPADDQTLRLSAVKVLSKLTARSKPAKAAATKAMLKLVEGGGCSAYKQRTCTERRLEACEAETAAYELPRDAKTEACFNCRYCERTTVGHGFAAALEWFKKEKEGRAEAGKALERLKAKKLIPAGEYRRLMKKIGVAAR